MKIVFESENRRAVAKINDLVIGFCKYEEIGFVWNIVSTFVDSNYQGKGIAKELVKVVINNAKKENKKLISDCSYAKKILEKIT